MAEPTPDDEAVDRIGIKRCRSAEEGGASDAVHPSIRLSGRLISVAG